MSKYRIGEFAARIGRSPQTVRRWEREGRIVAKRTPTGQRYFDESDVLAVLKPGWDASTRLTVVYCRVSPSSTRRDMESQISAMETFCLGAGIAVDEWVAEVGDSLNLNREKFVQLMDRIEDGRIARLVIAHRDRLARFGFEYVKHVADRHGCEIVVANFESLSPRQELVEDLLAIVHSFSDRLHGLRGYEARLKGELSGDSQ
ncbi:IS607 family transposase [Streptomyces sp. NPDC057740]|uniref:IS607 family transposase n=1 Tax=Streptomyces sp. NPDC057740 TaxID=3346234 RepID=UPI00369BF743